MSKTHKMDFLTDQDFYRFFQCPHWPYYERFGKRKDRKPLSQEKEEMLMGRLQTERALVKKAFKTFKEVKTDDPVYGWKQTEKFMQAGAPVIYRGWIMAGDQLGRPSILEKRPGKSSFGKYYYQPISIKRRHILRKEDQCQLAFYARILESIQKYLPTEPAVLGPDLNRLSFAVADFLTDYQSILEVLNAIRNGVKPDLVYRKSCQDSSPWGHLCRAWAEHDQDIALLFSVDVKKLRALRQLGIQRVTDAAEMDPTQLEGQSSVLSLKSLQLIQRQARTLLDQSIIVRKPFIDRTTSFEVHFDIESYPQTDTDYLFGFFTRNRETGEEGAISFFAETIKEEKNMWKAFLGWLSTLPQNYTVYHYASHEQERLEILAKRYGDEGHPELTKFLASMLDLKETVRDHVIFPLYFYSLKPIAGLFGYEWTGELKNGGKSIDVYERWLKKKSKRDLNALIRYNQHDVHATAVVIDWLRTYATQETTYAHPYPWIT